MTRRLSALRAREAALATVEGRRAAHALALAQPMVGCAFVGEPQIVGALPGPTPLEYYACRYATALLRQRDPSFSGDLDHLRARLDWGGIVRFTAELRCRRSKTYPHGTKQIEVAAVALPEGTLPSGTVGITTIDLRTGGRAAAPALPAPSVPAAPAAEQTEGTAS